MEGLLSLPELRSILRLSLQATNNFNATHPVGQSRSSAGELPDFEDSPAFRRLVKEITFSRNFIITYYFVVFLIIAASSAIHWWARYKRWTRKRAGEKTTPNDGGNSTASSSSSTLQGDRSPAVEEERRGKVGERTSLLPQQSWVETRGIASSQTTFLRRLSHRLVSFLSYQPNPVPALTSPTNVLPSNGTSLLIVAFLGVELFYLFYRTPLSIPMLFAFADRAGLCFVANLPVLYILAAKTNQPLKCISGWSYEGLNIFHRRLGEWMTILAALHSVGMFGVWYTLLRPFHFTFLRFLSSKVILLGIFTFIAYLTIYVTSTGYFRHLYYETFLGLHICVQVAALLFLFFHHHNSKPYVIACLGIWVFDRLVSRFIISSKTFMATLQVAKDGETVLLFCDVNINRFMATAGFDIRSGWQPGQHVFVTIPGIGWSHRLQAHPFSIASPAPPATLCSGKWPLELIIRAKDGFSRELLEYAKLHQHTKAILDGPYGTLDALQAVRHADRTCFIAGGSGIAVTYPLAWDLAVQKNRLDALVSTRIVYENGSKQVTKTKCLGTPTGDEFAHLWIKSLHIHETWITTMPKYNALTGSESQSGESEGVISVGSLITESISTQEDDGAIGRPDAGFMLRSWVENSAKLSDGTHLTNSICVVVSGPDGLVRDVRNAAAELVIDGWDIEVFVEKFGW